MKLIRSNRTETLADALASVVRENPLSPFAPEVVAVQSRGMERWLTLALAERLGIWSNPRFPFPRALIEEVLDPFGLGPSERAKAYDPDRLKWTIAQVLGESAPPELHGYLGDPPDADRALRFASSIADVFDRYVVYRPELLKRWAEGDATDWQAVLWRQIAARLGPHDLSTRIDEAMSSLQSKGKHTSLRLERLHLFSLETLPPLFLRFFSELSKRVPTWLYLLEPSSEYIGDTGPSRQLHLPMKDTPTDGHPFLYSVGRLSRDFQQLLLDVDESVRLREDFFEDPSGSHLLGSFQAGILAFRNPPAPSDRLCIAPSDDSISIHACTGPMREAQVLHDLIRGLLEADDSLQPEDIAVMTPDLETYAPAFRAVFGLEESHRISYEVHDRKTREDASFCDDFLAVLDVLESRFSVLDLVRLIDAGSLREDFRFNPEERARLTDLLAAAGVRWGIDAAHRSELEFPAEALHTWRAGLARLFLGFASMPQEMEVFAGLLPRGAPSLEDAELVARLSRLCDVLFDLHRRTRGPVDIDAWVAELGRMAALLFEEDGEAGPATRILRGAFQELQDLARSGGYTGLLSLKALRRELAMLLVHRTPPVGFLRKGVTLTELVPLRSVPFRVVCLMGMSEEAFPRADDRPKFDQTRARHRAGDRNKRHDDRHSFLQAILCARDRLIVTYSAPATSLRAEPNPTPVVWELRESINRCYQRADGEALLTPKMHPLHAFDRRYFVGGDLPRSFSRRHLQIARAIEAPASERPRIELRAEANELQTTVPVRELTSWLWNPIGAFVDRVLRARFDASTLYEPTGALTELRALDAARIGNGALRSGLHGDALHAYLEAAPEFPDGSWGQVQRERLLREIEAFGDARRGVEGDRELRSVRLAVELGDVLLDGRLDGLSSDRRVMQRFTKSGRKTEVDAWVEHLLMQAASEPGLPRQTRLVLRGATVRPVIVELGPVADPTRLLRELVELYQTCKTNPLPLLGESSRAYAERFRKSGRDSAVRTARVHLGRQSEWDPRLQYVLGTGDPFEDRDWAEAFEAAALALYAPLLDHRREG
jgi:exodeoxyribonuclease V gamma subunit